jgi:alkylated DNA repair dioxygenase AlkB
MERFAMSDLSEFALFGSELDTDPPGVNVDALSDATEHHLDDDSSISVVRGFIRGHHALLQQLSVINGWLQRQRWMYNQRVDEPRLTNEYRDLNDAPRILADIAATLSQYCGVPYDGIWMNWYRDNQDSTSWHADRPANVAEIAAVPVLSLGATRRFLIRPNGGGRSTVFTPAGGDLLIMRGRCQRDWQHCVPKQRTPALARMSLNFTSTAQASR